MSSPTVELFFLSLDDQSKNWWCKRAMVWDIALKSKLRAVHLPISPNNLKLSIQLNSGCLPFFSEQLKGTIKITRNTITSFPPMVLRMAVIWSYIAGVFEWPEPDTDHKYSQQNKFPENGSSEVTKWIRIYLIDCSFRARTMHPRISFLSPETSHQAFSDNLELY